MSFKKKTKKLLKKAWKYTKRFFSWLWEWIKFIFTCGYCGRKKEVEIIEDTEAAEKTEANRVRFDCDVTPEGITPRCADGTIDIDKIYAELPPSVREALKRQNEMQNRRPVLMRVQKTASAPAEIERRRAKNDADILEEKKADKGVKSDI